MKGLISISPAILLLAFPPLPLAKEKPGTDRVVLTKDNKTHRGELITVKQNSRLLLSDRRADVTVDIQEVRNLTIIKKSKAGKGCLYGALGTGGSIALGYLLEGGVADELFYIGVGGWALIGGIIGALFGAAAGRDETILVSTKTDAELKEILNQLHSKARVPEYN